MGVGRTAVLNGGVLTYRLRDEKKRSREEGKGMEGMGWDGMG